MPPGSRGNFRAPDSARFIGVRMNLHLSLTPLISLLAGILILVMPKLLNFIVAIYLIVIGLIGLLGTGALHLGQ
jgi:hypothetical protein